MLKKRFLDFADAWSAFNGDSTLDSFVTGFRFGAWFVLDTFLSEAPVKDEEGAYISPCLGFQGRG